MKFPSIRCDLRIALLYLLFGGLWILLTDRLLAALVPSISVLTTLQTYKGWGFVLASAALIFILLQRELRTRQLAEIKLRESEVRYRLITENASDLIYRYRIQPAPKFEFVSAASLAFTGYSPEEFYANPDLGLKIMHPADLSMIAEAVAANVPPANPLIARWIRKDGVMIWVEQRVTYYKDAADRIEVVDCVARDITGRKHAEETQRESGRQMKALVTSLDDIVFELDAQAAYLNIWTGDERLLVRPKGEMLGRTMAEIIGKEAARPFEESIQRAMNDGEVVELEYPLEVAGGVHWFLARLSPILSSGASGGTVSMLVRDITERKRSEQALQRSEEKYRQIFENAMEAITQTTPDGKYLRPTRPPRVCLVMILRRS